MTQGLAQTPRLLAGINRQPGPPASSFPQNFAWVGNTLYFAAYAPSTGNELYRSLGTASSTTLLHDLEPGPDSSTPKGFAAIAGTTVFVTLGDVRNPQAKVWRTDGSAAGTVLLADLGAIPSGTDVHGIFPLQGLGVFALNATPWLLLYRTDGTPAGTSLIARFVAAPGAAMHVASFAGALWLNFGGDLLRTDGTTTGTGTFASDTPSGPIAVLGNALYYCTRAALMRTDGTLPGTTVVVADNFAGGVTRVGTDLLCHTVQGLVRSDGTGSVLLRSFPRPSIGLGATSTAYYFRADDGTNGDELWRSDGTALGTQMVRDLTPGPNGTSFEQFGVVGTRLLFSASGSGTNLWVSDGTAAGTLPVPPQGGRFAPSAFAVNATGTRAAFAADDVLTGTGREPWLSDGTVAGTAQLVDLANPPGGTTRGSLPERFMELPRGTLFFADDGLVGHELWTTDGTVGGTRLVKDINPGARSSVPSGVTIRSSPSVTLGGVAYFAANDGVGGAMVWRSDGTPNGTSLVVDLAPGRTPEFPAGFVALDERRFVFGLSSVGFFVSDGTAAGTTRLLPGTPNEVLRFGQRLLLIYGDSATGNELWVSDGTVAGTRLLVDLTPGPASTQPTGLTLLGAAAYFYVQRSGPTRIELWRTDGTAGGTTLVTAFGQGAATMTAANGRLYLAAEDTARGREPWVSDGTAAGTMLLADTNPGPASGLLFGHFVGLRDGVLFSDAQGALWRTDGTPVSTRRLTDPALLPASAALAGERYGWLARTDGYWRSNATVSGTSRVLVSALSPGRGDSVGRVAHRILAAHDDGVSGAELWVLDEAAARVAVGTGCGDAWRTPQLEASDPELGAVMRLRVRYALPAAAVAVLLGGPAASLLSLPGTACAVHVDPFVVALPATSSGASWILDLPVPANPSLVAAVLGAQAICAPGGTPLGLDLSNGLRLTLGR